MYVIFKNVFFFPLQPSDDSVDCTSSAIEVPKASGTLRPIATENIVIRFLPQSIARFQQFFKLALRSENGSSHTCCFKVQGEVSSSSSQICLRIYV